MRPRIDRTFSVAPMMERTDRHCRYFMRLLSRRTLLYTEMVTSGAIIFGDRQRHLAFDRDEHPVALQLGGSDPVALADCAEIGAAYGYDEINLNIGCPSDRVQNGRFGACLMAEPQLVADCVRAMGDRVALPITVKCRIGIDDQDDYAAFRAFVDRVAFSGGCETFIVHARKAVLKGLSPKENREIPPLKYDYVYRLKEERPDLEVTINGGIASIEESLFHLGKVDGVMMGRAAYQNLSLLAGVDRQIFGDACEDADIPAAIEAFLPYVERELANGVRLNNLARHLIGLFQGVSGARAWRRYLAENATRRGAGSSVIREAAMFVTSSAVDEKVS
ncbi:MAG: tRNA dihydrouridine(20/20a) synthase DusA [Proteobacteria bacterium]|nr:tRNA dihydrouridine(20/20a) synthase DusA [Pseudomonadota bacterium]MDA1057687.1 tRNA dihydrouridine(20/20a) synthase DusA [Pseudomonadota bacterium]